MGRQDPIDFKAGAALSACLLAHASWGFAAAQGPEYGIGAYPTPTLVEAWDLSIPPDGEGLPKGKGTVAEGADVNARRCTEGHGDKGQGGDAEPLVGGKGTLRSPRPLDMVGSYGPYATTVRDYVNRAMPFDRPGMLTINQVYAVVAYLLAMNGIIDEAHELSDSTLPDERMPNRDSFVPAAETDLRTEPSSAVDGE